MARYRKCAAGLLATTWGLLAAVPAGAASLQQVSNWAVAGLPSDVSMYIYVPDKVATNPPILALVHYCGGTASAVFGQAQGGGIVSAADQYGFIMVVPSSGRCWDVESNRTFTRDGGGDSHAIAQMVRYTITKYSANADRVYSTGDSSGGMMTELLLGLYPDIFKAGASFAGIPAFCRGTNETGTGYSGQCAGGNVTHTAQEWGDIVRGYYPGYSGHRARVQLFHGDADTTISPKNQAEATKEWTNVLGLSTNPTTTSTVTLGNHQATRQTWQNSCGYVVLDTFMSIGGDHGPSDALFKSSYVIPFLGLDKTGATDPELAAPCGTGGTGGTGTGGKATGGTATGGKAMGGTTTGGRATGGTATGGSSVPSSGGTGVATGGIAPTGGTISATGGTATGGVSTSGGTGGTGGGPETCSCRTASSQDGPGKLFGLLGLCLVALRRRSTRR